MEDWGCKGYETAGQGVTVAEVGSIDIVIRTESQARVHAFIAKKAAERLLSKARHIPAN